MAEPPIIPPGQKIASFYVLPDAKARMVRRATKLGYGSFSEYARATLECGLEVSRARFDRLETAAKIKGVSVSALLAELIDRQLWSGEW